MQFVVLTGGPGAGKTAVLEVMRQHFCAHVVVLPETAGIIFGGGFPRGKSVAARSAGQRAIYRVQVELERLAREEGRARVVLCDRGTLDGLAYWPQPRDAFFSDNETTLARELARYDAVVHLRTPPAHNGYNHQNPLRTESAEEAAAIDMRVKDAWEQHPRRVFVENAPLFVNKLYATIDALHSVMPVCCTASEHWREIGRRVTGASDLPSR